MSKPLYLYGSVDVIRYMFDYDRIPVTYEDSYIWHEYLHLTRRDDAWELGELRVEFYSAFEDENSIEWIGESGYSEDEITSVIGKVVDVTYSTCGLLIELDGYTYMTDVTKRFGAVYKLGEILLQEQLVVSQKDSWEGYMQFCEKNSGFIFPKGSRVTLSDQGVSLKY